MNGDLEPVIINSIKFLGMFGFRGDPLWRNNVAHLPVFDLLLALFFYIGLLISLWRWQKQRYLFIVLWLFTAAIPSIVTIDAPSSIRIINALPILTLFLAIGLEVIQFFRPLFPESDMETLCQYRSHYVGNLLCMAIQYGSPIRLAASNDRNSRLS